MDPDEAPIAERKPMPKRWTFRMRLDGETTFFAVSVFAHTETDGKAMVNERYLGKVAEWR